MKKTSRSSLGLLTALLADRAAAHSADVPAGFTRDVREVWSNGRGADSLRWPPPTPLLLADLSNAEFPAGAWTWEGDVLVGHGITAWQGGKGNLWTKESYSNFVLGLDFRCDEKVNSGVLIRVGDVANWLQDSCEVQILQGTHENSTYLTGAIFDCAGPTRPPEIEASRWYSLVIIACGSRISIFVDAELVNDLSLDDWNEPRKNPDGTANRFKLALKDKPRAGRIGLQYHGKRIEFRNLLIEKL